MEHKSLRRVVIGIIALVIGITLGRCMPTPNGLIPSNDTKKIENGVIRQYIDEDAGVACWVYDSGESGGISCLPINQTQLPQEP
jgi:hypothetical protein